MRPQGLAPLWHVRQLAKGYVTPTTRYCILSGCSQLWLSVATSAANLQKLALQWWRHLLLLHVRLLRHVASQLVANRQRNAAAQGCYDAIACAPVIDVV